MGTTDSESHTVTLNIFILVYLLYFMLILEVQSYHIPQTDLELIV
jgi:hypothetical protein